jgi:hypothetical protein
MLTIRKLVGAAACSALLLTGLGLSDVALSSEKRAVADVE